MRRLLTAAVALSLGLTVLVPSVPAGHMAARVDAGAGHLSVDQPLQPEPVVVNAGSHGAAWTAKYGARPASYGLPASVLTAYLQAVAAAPPECHLSVSLLAAIGQVESGNLAGRLDDDNRAVPAIIGRALDGHGTRTVADTDAGRWDGDRTWDRALGPLQFIPSSWRAVGVDFDGDGVRDPQDLDDAAGAAMVYLCADGRDLGTAAGLRAAILSYNHSRPYLRAVLAWKAAFDRVDPAFWGLTSPFESWLAPGSTPGAVPGSAPASAKPVRNQPLPDATAAAAAGSVTATVPEPTTQPTPEPTPGPTPGPTSGPAPETDPGAGPASPTAPADADQTAKPTEPASPTKPAEVPDCRTPEPTPVPTSGPTSGPTTGPTSGPTPTAPTTGSTADIPAPTETASPVDAPGDSGPPADGASTEPCAPAPDPLPGAASTGR